MGMFIVYYKSFSGHFWMSYTCLCMLQFSDNGIFFFHLLECINRGNLHCSVHKFKAQTLELNNN